MTPTHRPAPAGMQPVARLPEPSHPGRTAARAHSVRRATQVPCRFQALRLRQPRRPQGRHLPPVQLRRLRQPQPVHQQRRVGREHRQHLRHPDAPEPGRAVHRVRPGGRQDRESPGQQLGALLPAPRSPLPRRPPDACRRRSVHLQCPDQATVRRCTASTTPTSPKWSPKTR